MPRVLSLYFPFWATDRLRRAMGEAAPSRDVPLALKGQSGNRRLITAVDDLALHVGARIGMPVAKAESLFGDMVLLDADVSADAFALEKVAIWALRQYSPLVAVDAPDGLILDITGAAHLYGGEAGLVADVVRRLSDLGITARAALADSWGAAYALARFGAQPQSIVAPGQTADALLPLPVEALRLPSDMIPDLRLLGLDTIGELAGKPRPPLTRSFGPLLFRRIDQAFGRLNEPIEPVESPELIVVERVFAEPIGAPETMQKYTQRLVDMMCERLEENGLGVRRLDLHFVRVDNRIETIFVGTAKPVRDAKRLGRLLTDKIETVDPGFGIDRMKLIAASVEPVGFKQMATAYAEPARPDVEDLWDTLSNRYGAGCLYRAVSVATDIPERAVRRLPPTAVEVGSRRNAGYRRPQRLYRRPEPIETLAALPDHPPKAFTWRRERFRVVCADGPERVLEEWWRTDKEIGKVRDYFILEVESGERFWVFRAGDGQHASTGGLNWFLHGKFD
ncbi:DNA polymerase Y family protein [Asticcacaulis sp. BYS171W]|uniref:DNA-directed DNA polymerase n=1 Tax=Asticcacaulis aquaticus TaxID=2984212 RepID=A0ABT5HQ21_9CAUL|nr:DNA polymerase Y family protein [Asticcacaulis aquaticus]MDC7682172.1 DNA polymerase Y family protein [Asticcacaulis aquaticus]